jgi:hypothetical protein
MPRPTASGPRLTPDQLLAELEDAAARSGVAVSYEALQASVGAGGLCRVKGRYRVIIDRRAATGDRLNTLAQALAETGVELELSPRARELVAIHVTRRAS